MVKFILGLDLKILLCISLQNKIKYSVLLYHSWDHGQKNCLSYLTSLFYFCPIVASHPSEPASGYRAGDLSYL